ncbi:MAG: 50S ribosomal protein L22 [Bacteroidales bacterium]|jgi:large subunit ribosomal protein L22|nr:50S ribosomal protein L22 [Bacteroidales bacterium]
MGARKRLAAEARKEQKRNVCMARLIDNSTSPRKTRLMADLVRGKSVEYALNVLKYSKKESSEKIRKLILSAVSNWQEKNISEKAEDSMLYVKEIFVDGGAILKRVRAASRAKACTMKKRSNHITVILDSKLEPAEPEVTTEDQENQTEE